MQSKTFVSHTDSHSLHKEIFNQPSTNPNQWDLSDTSILKLLYSLLRNIIVQLSLTQLDALFRIKTKSLKSLIIIKTR